MLNGVVVGAKQQAVSQTPTRKVRTRGISPFDAARLRRVRSVRVLLGCSRRNGRIVRARGV